MDTKNKVFNIAMKVAAWVLIVFTVLMMIFTVITVTTVDKTDISIFGYKFYIVLSDSMSKSDKNAVMDVHFNAGDIVIIENVEDQTALKKGDIIAFLSQNEDTRGKVITHMIDSVERDPRTQELVGYKTAGTNTGEIDESVVEPYFVLGTYSGKIPAIGHFFNFMKSVPGYIVCILVPFLLLILYNGVNVIRLFRKYKREQMAEIEEQRAENQRIMAELLELKKQLADKGENTPPSEN